MKNCAMTLGSIISWLTKEKKKANIVLYRVLNLLLSECNMSKANLDKDSEVIF